MQRYLFLLSSKPQYTIEILNLGNRRNNVNFRNQTSCNGMKCSENKVYCISVVLLVPSSQRPGSRVYLHDVSVMQLR
jgi:hypothetical protein